MTDYNNNDQGEAGADPVDPTLVPLIDQIRPMFEQLDAEYNEQQEKLDGIRERRQKLERAMRALQDNKPPSKVKDTAQKSHHDWKPSENLQTKVLAALRAAGDDGLTVSEGAKVTGLSNTAVEKVFRYLRGRETRLAGRRNNGALYKLGMEPDHVAETSDN